ESEFDTNKQPDSPASEEEPSTPRVLPSHIQSPKYQLFLNNELANGSSSRDADGPGGGSAGENGPRLARWESSRLGLNHYRGSLESLASRDWDTMSDRLGGFDSPPRVFNSPYTTTASMEYNPMYRMSEFKVQGGLSPATSELNLFSYNSRSTSPVPTPTLTSPRPRFSTYDSLNRRRAEVTNTVIPNHMSLRSATLGPNKRDYIEELTKQMDACQKRNQFLEAESVEMEKERNQIRFEMRGLLVNNEDLLRTNTQLTNEMKRMRDRMLEMERETQTMTERYRQMEIELKEARDMMVEANTQEYAFNFLQQSLKNKIQDAEESLEKQTLHAQSLAEKLWLAERQLEEFEVDKDTRDKKTSELNVNVLRLETELGDTLRTATQAAAELGLQQKLREDAQLRVEELEESLLEKDQELQRLQGIVNRLQGEVSGKLIDKERTLEEEIQLRERVQLQCKQAERTVDDLHMELQTANQARDDLAKQLKQAQEKMIDLESDLEELHDSEQRWAAKHKRAIEQTEQVQLKLIQEKDLNDQLDCEKNILERQLRELRLEVEELQSSRVQEDVITKSESRAKELENSLRVEERNKAVLSNTISKLERKINELSDQMEEDHRIAAEQKDLMTQRIRSLKRQLNEAEEDASRKEAQHRHTQRELTEERETAGRLQRQLLDQHLQMKRKESLMMRQTLDSLRLDLSVDEEDDDQQQRQLNSATKV
ncbi:myosin heavy chain, embryonic smooth muscle isoform-like, partial [Centroberyx affinis]|uniref:myosin heavy chain, embryonic smooth muscle isoform-like n=1 Tax=Centroberyx affinis TaxID=166261 RepID=UPI003A5C0B3F